MSVIEKTTGEVCEIELIAVKDHRVLYVHIITCRYVILRQ